MQSIRGMRDLLPPEVRRWQDVERTTIRSLESFGYEEIRLPMLEPTELFSRGLGEATDAVEKEMYNLLDRDGEQLSLRPEGTASCVRACLQHGLIFNQTQRLWYRGPMFRYERPQKGRYRQFEQIGAEAFGVAGPDLDAELIQMCASMFQTLGVSRELRLELNTLGSAESRRSYRDALVSYLTPLRAQLDADSQRRLDRNPLRILDSKDPKTQALLEGAPSLSDHLDARIEGAFRRIEAPARCAADRLRHQSAPGARARLLHAYRVRMGDRRARIARHRVRRRPLRRSRRTTRRSTDSRGGIRDRCGPAGAAARSDGGSMFVPNRSTVTA